MGGSLVAFAALGGMIFHLALDLLRLAWWGRLTIRVLSIVEYVIRRRRLRRRGLDPDLVYREALIAIGVHHMARPDMAPQNPPTLAAPG